MNIDSMLLQFCKPVGRVHVDDMFFSGPDPIVTCTNGLISASFSRITDPNLEEKHVSINMTYSGTCGMVKENTTDFITIRVPFDECGTNATV